ncbi:uncharacterized protein AMSG_09032 [Thecamonas trahens ATCC 50062]|uniref:Uncharacterized protein n=1 Tax=Thecamonas trahens ATCC 50062 TaxID=461836 RepID=A0A0L0DLF5_THETB|nr:hypothetical protein AMSG_09032 [Thecamonas trahens ATCC 50062]KNC52876.1 hypothetical protein AMSG_09032 [Thecamonas trahens ATCC 50062]|eukprot:XP_013754975.1 hypothetical protein AMSG_09032 [Thecamonas trahens ATCC 50062]
MQEEQQKCSHIGCNYHSNGSSRSNRAVCYQAHERNMRRHLDHFKAAHDTCPCCIQMISRGLWTLDMARDLDSGVSTVTYKKDYKEGPNAAQPILPPVIVEKVATREVRASRRRESRRRGGEVRGGRANKRQTVIFSMADTAKAARQVSQATVTPYGRSKLALALQSENWEEMAWALNALTTLVYAPDAQHRAKAVKLTELPPATLDHLLAAIHDLCRMDDLNVLAIRAADPHAAIDPSELYSTPDELRSALSQAPHLATALDSLLDAHANCAPGVMAPPPSLDIMLELAALQATLGSAVRRHENLRAAFNIIRFLALEPHNVATMAAHSGLYATLVRTLDKLPEDVVPLAIEIFAQLAGAVTLSTFDEASDEADTTASGPAPMDIASEPTSNNEHSAQPEKPASIVPVLVSLLHTSDDARVIRGTLESLAALASNLDNGMVLDHGPSIYARAIELIRDSGVSGLIAVLALRMLNNFCALDMSPRVAIAAVPGTLPLLLSLLDPNAISSSYVPFAAQQLILYLVGAPANRPLFRIYLDAAYALMEPSSSFQDLGTLIVTELIS